MRRPALAGALVVLLLGTLLVARPFLTRDRFLLTTSPQPPPLDVQALLELSGGEQACLDRAMIDERSEQVSFRVGTFGRPSSPLRVTIRGRDYRDSERVSSSAYIDNGTVVVPVDAPGSARLVAICIRNEGQRKIALYASDHRSRSRTRVAGGPVEANVVVLFGERQAGSLLEHVPVALRRMTAFRPVGEWLLWPLAILFTFAVPAGALAAYLRSIGSADEDGGQA